uniref:hypothetical protein n=1 Tax=Alistipes sp. TaxID=1872444 RepID=UPI004056B06F
MNIKSIEEFTIGDCRSYLLQDSDSEVGKMVLAHLLTLLGEMEQKSKGETQSHKGELVRRSSSTAIAVMMQKTKQMTFEGHLFCDFW